MAEKLDRLPPSRNTTPIGTPAIKHPMAAPVVVMPEAPAPAPTPPPASVPPLSDRSPRQETLSEPRTVSGRMARLNKSSRDRYEEDDSQDTPPSMRGGAMRTPVSAPVAAASPQAPRPAAAAPATAAAAPAAAAASPAPASRTTLIAVVIGLLFMGLGVFIGIKLMPSKSKPSELPTPTSASVPASESASVTASASAPESASVTASVSAPASVTAPAAASASAPVTAPAPAAAPSSPRIAPRPKTAPPPAPKPTAEPQGTPAPAPAFGKPKF